MNRSLFLIELAESERTALGRIDFGEQSEPQKVFTSIWTLESEVNNGGFDQFFINAEPELNQYVARALRQIGAHHCANIVDRAVGLAASTGVQQSEVNSALESLDADFQCYSDNLTDLLFEYVEHNPGDFGPVPTLPRM